MSIYSIGILSLLLSFAKGEGIGKPQDSATKVDQLPRLSSPISNDQIKGPWTPSIRDESIDRYGDNEQFRELVDRWYNEIFLQLPLCPPPEQVKPKEIATSCRPLPPHFTPYVQSCDKEKAHANCNLRTSVPFHSYTVYGPDYSGIDSSNCTALRKPWIQASNSWHYNVGQWATATNTWTTTKYGYSTSTITSGGTSYGSLITTSSSVFATSWTDSWNYPKYPIAAPCNLQISDQAVCSSLQSKTREMNPTGVRGRSTWRDPDRELIPGCTAGCDKCAIRASTANVLYWPTPAISDASPTEIETAKVIAVHNGITYTSPTVYVSFETLSATNNCGIVGQKYGDVVVTLPRDETLTSLEGYAWHWTAKTARSFDFKDLNQPISVDVYRKLWKCGAGASGCQNIRGYSNTTCACPVAVLNDYTPKIVIPNAVRTVDAEWSNCYLDVYGVDESPIALKPTSVVKHQEVYSTAVPGSYPPPYPIATAKNIPQKR